MSQRYTSFYSNGQLLTFMEVYSLCVHSYEDLRYGQELTGTGYKWTVTQVIVNGGFVSYSIKNEDDWHAIVFRGTDFEDPRDWIFNNINNALGDTRIPQYVSGDDVVSKHGAGKILVGHSLGGGIASFASAFSGVPAVTIFPAPVVPGSLPEGGAKANVVNYCCHGEVLTELTNGGRSGSAARDIAVDILDSAIAVRRPRPPLLGRAPSPVHRRLGTDFFVESTGSSPVEKHMLNNIVL